MIFYLFMYIHYDLQNLFIFRSKKRDTELASLGEQPTNLKKHRTGSVDNLLDTLSRQCVEEDNDDDQVFTAESTASESGIRLNSD